MCGVMLHKWSAVAQFFMENVSNLFKTDLQMC